MYRKGNTSFLSIDGVEELINDYCKQLDRDDYMSSHIVIFHGDTGCGKTTLSNECIKKVQEKNENISVIDLLDHFKTSNYDSLQKLTSILKMIEYQLIGEGAFGELKDKSSEPEIFKTILKKLLETKGKILLIRFPLIEVYEEIDKYYDFFYNNNTIIYFVTDNKKIVDECKHKLGVKAKYYKCTRLKQGDGELVANNIIQNEKSLEFESNGLEYFMSMRPSDNKMSIKELLRICDYSCAYAKEKGITKITKDVIVAALAYNGVI